MQTTPEQSQKNKSNRKKGFTIFLLLIILAAAAGGYYYVNFLEGTESTEDAYVVGNLVQVNPEIQGTVTSITVDDGDFVQQGQALVQFDKADADIKLQSAKANLAQSVRQVRSLFNGVAQAQAVVDEREIALQKAERDYKRRQNMVKAGGLSREELSHAKDTMNSAKKALDVALQQLNGQQAMVGNTTVATHPLVTAAAAQVRQAYLDLQRTSLIAPVSGYIARRNVQVGQRVGPGATLMAVVPLTDVWVEANFKETQLKDMRIGQEVILTADLYGEDVVYHGKIESLGIGTGSAFSVLPAQNATGNWIKVVQRLPVRVSLDKKELATHPLRIGLSMTAEVETTSPEGELLSTSAPAQPRFETDIYSANTTGVDEMIDAIITQNDVSQAQ